MMDPSVKFDCHVCGKNAEVEGDLFKFKGESSSVGVVKITEPMSPMLNYFEYEIIDKGLGTAIGIGVGEHKYPLDRMPGWNRCGIGYHADDGRLFHENGYGKAFGPLCTTGDRMGCGIDFNPSLPSGYVNVFFTKNGVRVMDLIKMKRPLYGLYPLIGLHSKGEIVRYLGHWRRDPNQILEPMETDRFPSSYWLRSNAVRYVEDGLTLEYDAERQDVAIAQGNFPLTTSNHYFELEILDSGVDGCVAIGVAKLWYPLTKHPGWCTGSVGYHADNGHLYTGRGQGDPFGPTCTEGDLMGCGIRFMQTPPTLSSHIDPTDEGDEFDRSFFLFEEGDYAYYDDEDIDILIRQSQKPSRKQNQSKSLITPTKCIVYFTKNGEVVGETESILPPGGYYPVVAMLSKGEKIKVDLFPLSG
jgi:hypothetical protein